MTKTKFHIGVDIELDDSSFHSTETFNAVEFERDHLSLVVTEAMLDEFGRGYAEENDPTPNYAQGAIKSLKIDVRSTA